MNSSRLRLPAIVSPTRFTAYAAAGATIAASQKAEAAVSFFTVNTVILDTTADGVPIGLDLLFDGFHLALVHGIGTANAATGYALADPDAFGSPAVLVAGFIAGNYNYVTRFNAGAAISSVAFLPQSAVATMAFNQGFTNSQFEAPGIGYLGVNFDTDRYGWVRVQMSGTPLNSITVLDYAYGGKGEQVLIGQVPEPTGLSLLALGSAGLATWRRRKTAAA